MTYQAIIVALGIIGVLLVNIFDKMRPGFTLLACAILFMVTGVISKEELLAGFSNREMITIAMLFLVGEGVRRSGSLSHLAKLMLPKRRSSVGFMMAKVLTPTTLFSMFLNNTAVVIIFAPIVKRWSEKIGVPATKFLIPLSYATILGGLCTLIGTSTNMVVNGLMQGAGYDGFTMFELGKVGGVIALVGLVYLFLFGNRLLPDGDRPVESGENNPSDSEAVSGELSEELTGDEHDPSESIVEVLLMARFPGVGLMVEEFDFYRHYGARIVSIKRKGVEIDHPVQQHVLSQGDTLRLSTDEAFVRTWRDSSAFYIVSGVGEEEEQVVTPIVRFRRWVGLVLVLFMVVGATLGGQISKVSGGVSVDMFLLAAVVMVLMALLKLFPVKRYTKFITWDILIAIAAAFAISKALSNSGISDMIANWILSSPKGLGAYGVLALLYLVTMLLTEIITNSAAVAITFPVALALSQQMGIDPRPLFVAICMAASASFSSPIGYQTNLIVQGVGGYRFMDYLRIGIWLNLLSFIISLFLIPLIWNF